MRLPDALQLSRRVSTPAIARRGLLISTLVLLERLLIPAAAWTIFGRPLVEKLAVSFALGVVFSARTFVQHMFRARTEADLLQRVVSALLNSDVLRANILPDEDARAELGQAVYHATLSVSLEIPLLLADSVAAAMLTLVILAQEPGRLVAVAVALTLVAAVALLATRRSIDKALEGAWAAQQQVFADFVDALEGRLEIVASGRRAAFVAKMHARTRAWATASTRVAAEAVVSGKLPLLAIAGVVAVGVTLAGARWRSGFGVTTADIALLASTTPAFSGVGQGVLALARAERWMGVVARVVGLQRAGGGGMRRPPELPASIAFDRVSFRYEGMNADALREVSFLWGPERVLALAGPNGSGKSTCLRLLLALGAPRAGAINVGGERLDAVDEDAWRATIAFLPQRPYLPPRSDMRAAVRFLAPDATDETIRRALDRVGLLASLKRVGGDPLAVRIDTLSVGERQRVGLARLLCQQASLVLLDEPDANLDRAGIALVADLVRELSREGMVALAAHTAELLDIGDRVVMLDQGRVIRDEARVRLAAP
jgi:ABC-type multidrug transport system fused ATPase/permease subunit